MFRVRLVMMCSMWGASGCVLCGASDVFCVGLVMCFVWGYSDVFCEGLVMCSVWGYSDVFCEGLVMTCSVWG